MLYTFKITYIDRFKLEREKTIIVKTFKRLLQKVEKIKKISLQSVKLISKKDLTTNKIYDIM